MSTHRTSRFAVLAAAASLSAPLLSACSGGSSLPGAGGLQAQSRAAAQAKPPVTNPYPFTQGDVFNYAYAETLTTKASGQPTVKTYHDATVTETVGGMVTYAGQQVTDFQEADNYTYSNSKHQTTGTAISNSDHYRAFVTNGNNLDYISWGDVSSTNETDVDGTTIQSSTQYTYDNEPYLLDVIPEVKSTWQEELANTQSGSTSTTSNGVTITTTYNFTRNSDLSYVRLYTYSKPGQGEFKETDTLNSDASGSDVNNGKTDPTAGTTTFSAPAVVGGKYVITVVYTPPSGQQTATQVPDWFPGHGKLKSLVSDTRKDAGTVTVPKSCGKATAGQSSTELEETSTYLDPILGTYSAYVDDYYVVAGEGIVCAIRKYTVDTYDNRNTGALTQSVSATSTSGLTSESLKNLRSKGLVLGFART